MFKTSVLEVFEILLVVIATMAVSSPVISYFTYIHSILSFRKGLNPDIVVYPVVSTVADIIVTLTYLAIILLTLSSWGVAISLIIVILFIYSTYKLSKSNLHENGFKDTIKEFILTLFVVSIIVNLTGTILEKITKIIGNSPEVYSVYPALIDTVGDVGSIVGSTASTKIALGIMTSSIVSIRHHLKEITGAWVASLCLFWTYSVIASSMFGIEKLGVLFFKLTLLNFIVIPIIIFISFGVTIVTDKRGWNPDNFIIPIESSLSDSVTTMILLIVLIL